MRARSTLSGEKPMPGATLERMFPFWDERFRVVSAWNYFCFRLFWSLALVDTLPFLPGKAEGRGTHAASNRL